MLFFVFTEMIFDVAFSLAVEALVFISCIDTFICRCCTVRIDTRQKDERPERMTTCAALGC